MWKTHNIFGCVLKNTALFFAYYMSLEHILRSTAKIFPRFLFAKVLQYNLTVKPS